MKLTAFFHALDDVAVRIWPARKMLARHTNARGEVSRELLKLVFGQEFLTMFPTKRQLSIDTVAGQARRKRRLAKVVAREQRRNRKQKPIYEEGYRPPIRVRSLSAFF
jgi:hypothetical protein